MRRVKHAARVGRGVALAFGTSALAQAEPAMLSAPVMHREAIRFDVGGEAYGYLEFVRDGERAYNKRKPQAVFVPGPAGKWLPNGVWQVVGPTGKLARLEGTGTLNLIATGPTERRFVLEGELIDDGRA